MKIYAHSLVKNEGRWLWFSVMSVINYVDKILLWDTGSSDESLQIENELASAYPKKIILKNGKIDDANDFTKMRQEMLDATDSDWILMLDGDEIWWKDSIEKVVHEIKNSDEKVESIVVPTINLVGDIFHYQENTAGRYKFGDRVGHFNLRALRRDISYLHSLGEHGVWGWADGDNKMIQDRNTFKFVDSPYLHATFLPRSSGIAGDKDVLKRAKKMKYEIGQKFPPDYFYPEVFFGNRPNFVESPWEKMSSAYKFRAFFETPLRKLKRRIWQGKVGY